MMLENSLERLAEKILALDEASLAGLYDKYKTKMENFETTKEWEKAVIIFFIINAVRVKNKIFNESLLKAQDQKRSEPKRAKAKPDLKLVK